MPMAPTEYAPEVQELIEETGAQAVFILVLGGTRGGGASAQCPGALLPELARQLRGVAKKMDKDYAQWIAREGS